MDNGCEPDKFPPEWKRFNGEDYERANDYTRYEGGISTKETAVALAKEMRNLNNLKISGMNVRIIEYGGKYWIYWRPR